MNKNRLFTIGALAVAIVIFAGSAFWWGFRVGRAVPANIVISGANNLSGDGVSVADFGTFWEAWQKINELYLNTKDISNTDKLHGAISGLVASLGDPYSQYFPPAESEKFQEDIQGSFGGIGVEIGLRKDQLVIIAPLKNTPAAEAGLRPSDQILQINSTSTFDITLDQAVNYIRGPENTTVTLKILRADWGEPKDFTLKRTRIVVPTLDYEMKEGNIAYVQLYSFNTNAPDLFRSAMIKAFTSGAEGIVLDLRNNPGGYLDVAVDLAGWFVPRGTLVVSEAGREGVKDKLRANGNAALVDVPIAVLINKGSASASEILAGTLRDNRKTKLVGEQSFGKGTVQEIQDLSDGSLIKLTVAHWVLPSGHILESEGLVPDVEVALTDEDVEKGRDPQLSKAFEVVKQEINK